MSAVAHTVRLATVEIRSEQDVVLSRQRAREVARLLGFERQVQTSVATAVSEIARNAFRYARGGQAEFSAVDETSPADSRRIRQSLIIEVRDNGPGIANLEDVLAGRYRSETGLGIGIVGTKRLMDRVQIASTASGTTVTLAKALPSSVNPRTARELQQIVDELAGRPVAGPLDELQVQNQELLVSMEEARKRQEELSRVNQELADTNSGVLALYDELETLNRISIMLASKLELKPLIQSIIDVTTNVTAAEIGAFFLREETQQWRLYATSGARADVLMGCPGITGEEILAEPIGPGGPEHIPDVEAQAAPSMGSRFAKAIAGAFRVRSCLTVPVIDAQNVTIGAIVFASAQPKTFTERSERILASVATQAAVGIEKAQLFQTVTAASEAKDQFFAALSHELRTPLNPALAIASSLQGDDRIPPDLREDIATIARNIRLEARLIDDLLDFNRLINGKLELATVMVDVHDLITNVIAICREDLEAKRQELTHHFHAAQSNIMGDAARLQQVLWNVLKNAIKFTPAQGCISIRTGDVGSMVRVQITDTGRGIDAGSLERIFTAFDQGKTHLHPHFGGLGLGLAIARMFVELHHGSISAESAGLDQGATITIELPRSATSSNGNVLSPSTERVPLAAGVGKILLVDDHADTLSALTRLLTRRGFSVKSVASATEALAAAEGEKFDLLVSDLGLPDLSGLELMARIRQFQDLPGIALSGYGMEADVARSKAAGFRVHITKPVEFEELITATNELMGASHSGSAAV